MAEYFWIEVIEGIRVTLFFLTVLMAAILVLHWTR
jgi:hypothetical protein